jgi:hypothetical protein
VQRVKEIQCKNVGWIRHVQDRLSVVNTAVNFWVP